MFDFAGTGNNNKPLENWVQYLHCFAHVGLELDPPLFDECLEVTVDGPTAGKEQ